MPGFIRRFGFFPGTEIITEIEGVVIVDLPPPGAVNGVGVGTVAVVGEFTDMSFGVDVNIATGVVTTKAQPVEIFSAQDLLNKIGGFDPTIGEFGKSGGNGFLTIRNKRYSRLVAVPVNLTNSQAVRMWRELATNTSATDPTPVAPIDTVTVPAGREFRSGSDRVRSAGPGPFTALGVYDQGVDGDVTAGVPAVTQMFSSPAGGFLTAKAGGPVEEGDIVVLGVIGGAAALGANAFTYRVTADATVDTQLTVEKLDGASFDWTTGTALPWRIHFATDADTGGNHELIDPAGYQVPARTLDATIAAATTLPPTLVPPALTATTADPLSGLNMQSDPSVGLTHVATVQAANAASSAELDALYDTAIDGLLGDELPAREVNILNVSRTSTTIRAKQKTHVLQSSSEGVGRISPMAPDLQTLTVAAVTGDADPGVGANRDERIIYDWPGAATSVPEAVGFALGTALAGVTTDDGVLDTPLSDWMASVLSILPPELNPGQAGPPGDSVMANILGFQRGTPKLSINEYKLFRRQGIAALRIDRIAGAIFQSGITSSLTSGQKNINRRRMADFIEDSLAQQYVQFSKKLLTDALKDSIVAETHAFLTDLLSPNNPPAQRIAGFIIDDVSGNTPESVAKGIFVVIAKVRTLATGDFIVLQAEVGENVNVTAT